LVLIDLLWAHKITRCRFNIVVLGFGSVEYHGDKLPYGTDLIIVDNIVKHCLRDTSNDTCIYIYPPIPYGYSIEWMDYPGTVNIEPGVYIELVENIVDSINRNLKPDGYILVNGHGGNYNILKTIVKNLYYKHGKPIILIDIWRTASKHGLKYCHACPVEAELLNILTNSQYHGVEDNVETIKDIDGYIEKHKPGQHIVNQVDTGKIIEEICHRIKQSINIIKERKQPT